MQLSALSTVVPPKRGEYMLAQSTLPAVAAHGAKRLPSVEVDSYNVELKDDEGFIWDRASKGAFWQIIENWRLETAQAWSRPAWRAYQPTAD
jgi:hypothetical protein